MSDTDKICRDANGAIDVKHYVAIGRELHGIAFKEAGRSLLSKLGQFATALRTQFRLGCFAKPRANLFPPVRHPRV